MFNPNDYIIEENIERFRNFMVSDKTMATALYGDYSDDMGYENSCILAMEHLEKSYPFLLTNSIFKTDLCQSFNI